REVRDFLERDLGEGGPQRSVVVVATSDQPPLVRLRGAYAAMALAEYFRDQGQEVIFMMDSLTRFAMAQREVGLSVGEPPTSKGFTPSVFALLPKLLERAGTTANRGSITGFYTVLVEGDDFNEPIADAVRAILDGHIVLSRDLTSQGHYPPIDILRSLSRVMSDIIDPKHREWAQKLRSILATYRQVEDLLNIGAYVPGKNPKTDYAIRMIDAVNDYLIQDVNLNVDLPECLKRLEALLG
ncbi:MAG: EscN/YscN/HrcN family type III secretion system ATPase, partial [Candidatus Tectomicrobia bacterium]|nr:EscN/YscN/HrcN family type III secretion system ATPase [Candidatus Tectomicrobia bacterium]